MIVYNCQTYEIHKRDVQQAAIFAPHFPLWWRNYNGHLYYDAYAYTVLMVGRFCLPGSIRSKLIFG